ncbi:MAG: hypothetical protein PUG74_10300, partial [Prevotellaceae bacterium]|nr:hypothetical protein [Prevotellaceae bacterium]
MILKMALNRPAGALGTIVLALVLVMACVSTSGFVSAYGRAVERGAQSSFGGYARQVMGNEDVATYMRYLQEKGEAVAISHARQNILKTGTQKAATADATIVSGPANLGVLVAGRYPNKPGELSVSSAVAQQLQAELGDCLELIDVDNTGARTSVTLRGITENPASINEVSAVVISDSGGMSASAEVWLTNDDLAAVSNALEHGGGEVATVTSVIERASDNAVSYQAVSPQVARLFSGLII